MSNYTKGQIYMIEPKCEYEEGDVYYGSTIQPLSKRIGQHRCIKDTSSRFLIEKYGEVKIVLVKLFPCNSKQELEAEEAKYIRENKCINKKIPLRTKKEYREVSKEKFNKYYIDNIDKIKKQANDRYNDNADEILEQKKEYYKKNKEKILEKVKEYREIHKEKYKEKITCECGCIVLKRCLSQHKQTSKHLKNMP